MMKHLTDESLVAHYYEDDDARASRTADEHLSACEECRTRMTELEKLLGAIQPPETPERGNSYGENVWNRIRAHLPERQAPRWYVTSARRWAWAPALAALVIAAFLLGRSFQPTAEHQGVSTSSAPDKIKERLLIVALRDDLERSQMVLIELMNAPDTGEPVDISAQQHRAENLVDSTRLYRQTALDVGDDATARVLDQLERTFVDIARSPSELNEADLKCIQQRIESQGLIFKTRIIRSRLQRQEDSQGNGKHNRTSDSQSKARTTL
jgi:hypothetical protein